LNPVNGAKNLAFSNDIKKIYTVKFAGKINPTLYADWFEFTIPFKMASPYIIGSFEKILVGSGTLNNEGNVETSLVIEVSGVITDPSIVIGGDAISYSGTIGAGQTLLIDTEAMTAELDGVNVIQNLTCDLPLMLQPGKTTITANSNVTVIFRDRWV
jgi:phage-related protein